MVVNWLGRQDSNLRMAAPKAAALPLGHAPILKVHKIAGIPIFGKAQPKMGQASEEAAERQGGISLKMGIVRKC